MELLGSKIPATQDLDHLLRYEASLERIFDPGVVLPTRPVRQWFLGVLTKFLRTFFPNSLMEYTVGFISRFKVFCASARFRTADGNRNSRIRRKRGGR